MSAWAILADQLRSRYPDDWAERYKSYKDGSNPDVQRWRAIGGAVYTPDRKPASDPWFSARNDRVRDANRAGVPLCLIAERFGISASAVSEILNRFDERASR